MSATYGNATFSVTHLLWCDRWIEVCKSPRPVGGWVFKTGRDAATWLLWPPQAAPKQDGEATSQTEGTGI